MDYSSLLNKDQLEAVISKSQYTRVVAGAGSGKTRVLTYRIAYLISELKVDPSSILAIAFTNKVANEMKNRIINLIPEVSSFLHISTFHSFGVKFLRSEIYHLNFSPSFTIFDEDDTKRLIQDICVGLGYSKKDEIINQSLNFIRSKKAKGEYPDKVKIGLYENEETCLDIYKKYEARKQEMIALDFDDLLLEPIIILEKFPDVREKWQHILRYILIDEFQDTNDVQFKLVKLLSNSSTSVYVVGDPDQTIYTWRGANQKIILNFEQTYKGAKTIILNQNYRSTKNILAAANKLIANNKERVKKDLFTNNINGEDIKLIKEETKELEAKSVISYIKRLIAQNKITSLRDIAILYRSSYLTLPFEKELTKEHITYRIFGGVRFYQRKEIKDALAYFRLILNPKDDVSFDRIINVPKRKIGERSIEILKTESRNYGSSYYEYIKNIDKSNSELSNNVINSLQLLSSQIEAVKNKLDDDSEVYSKVLSDFLIEIGYYDYLDQDDEAEERKENLNTLFEDMLDFIKKNPEDGFATWLSNCTLATSQDDMSDDDYVSLMTAHTAKGLEFNYVFVVGLADSIFPNQRALNEKGHNGLEEERRLCYVAFTRAKQVLILTMNNGWTYLNEGNPVESRFISEAGLKMPELKPKTIHFNFTYDKKYSDATFFDNPIVNEKPLETNNVDKWNVGDCLMHDVFGFGVVKKIVDSDAILVEFESCGKKTMLAKHKTLKRIDNLKKELN